MLIYLWLSLLINGAYGSERPVPSTKHTAAAVNGSLDNYYDVRRALDATLATFKHLFTQFLNSSLPMQLYQSQCLPDFAALFTIPGGNDFKASKGLEALDALGRPGSNILYGNLQMWGSYDECLNIGEDLIQYWLVPLLIYAQSSPTVPPVQIIPSPIRFGVCVPRSCNFADLQFFLNITNTFLLNDVNGTQLSVAANYDYVLITKRKTEPLNSGAVAMVIVCGIFVVLALVGSIADIANDKINSLLSKTSFPERDLEYCSETTPILHGHANTCHNCITSSIKKAVEYFTAFSLFRSMKMALSTQQPPTTISCLNGIRVLSMFWIISSHYVTISEEIPTITNAWYFSFHIGASFSYQVYHNHGNSVDSFFLLSGTLVAYHTLREMEKRRGRFPVVTYYLHRYLRVTMVYAFVIFFWWALIGYLGNGPIWNLLYERYRISCNKYWWTNLLYVNNFYPQSEGCMGWTWYLAADMQFYIVAPLILSLLYYIFPLGIVISIVGIVVTVATSGAIAGVKELSAGGWIAIHQPEYMSDIYIKPYCRAPPYIIGLILGFLLYRKVKINIHLLVDWLIYCAMWVVAAGCCFSVVYGLYSSWNGHHLTRAEDVSFLMFNRFVWGFGIALVVFACHNGYGWIINDFLSLKLWIPLSRFTYSAYIMHAIVVYAIICSTREPYPYSDYITAVYIVSIIVLSYGAAGVVAVFVEFPLSNLESLVFKTLGLTRRQKLSEETATNNVKSKNTQSNNKATASFSTGKECNGVESN